MSNPGNIHFSFPIRCCASLFVLTLLCGVGLNSPIRAQRAQPLDPIKPLKPEWEKWLDNVPVSGDVRVGVMAGAGENTVTPEVFTVLLPASDLPLLCVEVTSQDGRYQAELEYDIRGITRGPIKLNLPTKHGDKLSANYKTNQLAILAQLNQRCDASSELFVVSSWNNRTPTDPISVFVNSRVPTYIIGSENGNLKHEVRCNDIRGGNSIAYNLRCDLSSSWITPSTNFYIRRRTMSSGKIRNVDRPLPLRLP